MNHIFPFLLRSHRRFARWPLAAALVVAVLSVSACAAPERTDGRFDGDGTVELSDDETAASAVTAEGDVQERSNSLGTTASGRTAGSFSTTPVAPTTTKAPAKGTPAPKSSPTSPPVAGPPPFEGFRLDVTTTRVVACNDHSLARTQRVDWQNFAEGLFIVTADSEAPVVQYVNTEFPQSEGSLTLAPGECRELIVVNWDEILRLGCFDPVGTDCNGAATVPGGEYKVKFVWPARETDAGGNEVMYPGVTGVYSAPFALA